MNEVVAWHFLKKDKRLRFGDREFVEVDKTFSIKEKPELCELGFHASLRAIDALDYAPGPIVCRVQMGGEIIHSDDKLVAQQRTVIWMADASTVLHEMACWFAERALLRQREKGNEPDKRSWAAIEAKRKWLKGEITDKELGAAWVAAGDAGDAAGVAGAAAWAAARDARDARVAAWVAARDAGAAERKAQNEELERRLFILGQKECAA